MEQEEGGQMDTPSYDDEETQQDWVQIPTTNDEEQAPQGEWEEEGQAEELETEEEQWYQQEYGEKEPEETPIPAPAIVPIKGVMPNNRPVFVPLNAGGMGKGGVTFGHPTPLTHPAPLFRPVVKGKSKGTFMHPIDDPRNAHLFGKRGGWQPPEPPVPPMMMNWTPYGMRKGDVPAQSKAQPFFQSKGMGQMKGKGIGKQWYSGTTSGYDASDEDDEDDDESLYAQMGSRRRKKQKVHHVWLKVGGGKKVLAEYSEP